MKTLFKIYFKGGPLAAPFFIWLVNRPKAAPHLENFEDALDDAFGRHDRWITNVIVGSTAFIAWPLIFGKAALDLVKKCPK